MLRLGLRRAAGFGLRSRAGVNAAMASSSTATHTHMDITEAASRAEEVGWGLLPSGVRVAGWGAAFRQPAVVRLRTLDRILSGLMDKRICSERVQGAALAGRAPDPLIS